VRFRTGRRPRKDGLSSRLLSTLVAPVRHTLVSGNAATQEVRAQIQAVADASSTYAGTIGIKKSL